MKKMTNAQKCAEIEPVLNINQYCNGIQTLNDGVHVINTLLFIKMLYLGLTLLYKVGLGPSPMQNVRQ